MSGANPARGEAALQVGGEVFVLRPSFEALVAAEGELGSLFALVERASEGRLTLGEVAALFWHCVRERPEVLTRESVGAAVAELGLVRTAPVLKLLLTQSSRCSRRGRSPDGAALRFRRASTAVRAGTISAGPLRRRCSGP